jgi:hypothetical protein
VEYHAPRGFKFSLGFQSTNTAPDGTSVQISYSIDGKVCSTDPFGAPWDFTEPASGTLQGRTVSQTAQYKLSFDERAPTYRNGIFEVAQTSELAAPRQVNLHADLTSITQFQGTWSPPAVDVSAPIFEDTSCPAPSS